MSATLEVHQVRTNTAEGHMIETTVVNSTVIPKELFVVDAVTDEFSHVASLTDFHYPAEKDVQYGFYRTSAVSRVFENVETALKFVTYTNERLDEITKAYTQSVTNFVGTDTIMFPR